MPFIAVQSFQQNKQKLDFLNRKSELRIAGIITLSALLAACGSADLQNLSSSGAIIVAAGNVEIGLGANDVFRGGPNADYMDGGGGTDVVDYSASQGAVNVSLEDGGTSGDADGDSYNDIEILIGSDFDDTLSGDSENNYLFGGEGDDTFTGSLGADVIDGGEDQGLLDEDLLDYSGALVGIIAYLDGTSGQNGIAEGDQVSNVENLTGSDFNDILGGDDNDNIIIGLDGDDVIEGYGGDDQLFGGNGNDQLFGGSGNDTYDGGNGDDLIMGGVGDDILSGGNGDDRLSGGQGIDYIDGGDGIDTLISYYDVFSYIIDKDNGKIVIADLNGVLDNADIIRSIEFIEHSEDLFPTIDVKNIWSDISVSDQAQFNNNEAEFLTWLGDDSGYDYYNL